MTTPSAEASNPTHLRQTAGDHATTQREPREDTAPWWHRENKKIVGALSHLPESFRDRSDLQESLWYLRKNLEKLTVSILDWWLAMKALPSDGVKRHSMAC
jgi:hypothetical protein